VRAGFTRPLMAGVMQMLPMGLRVQRKVEQIIRDEMNRVGGQEVLLSSLQPKELWQTAGRWEDLTKDVMYHFKDGSGREVGLGMSHEEPMVSIAGEKPLSYKDLPFALYQIATKFRDEPRAKAGLLRGREFLMKDLYSFHANTEDLNKYYDEVAEAYRTVYKRLDLPAVYTISSGGVFTTEYSHEFQTLTDAGEDTIYLCNKCQLAVNDEVIADFPAVGGSPAGSAGGGPWGCPECHGELETAKAIEVGNIFKLGTKYSKPFNLTYTDADGQSKLVEMGCYGIGVTRTMGAIVETHNDDRGLIWPISVAPYHAHLLDLTRGEGADRVREIQSQLEQAGVEVLVDDRPDVSAGEKLTEADLFGLPFRLVISAKTGENVELKERASGEVELLSIPAAVARIIEAIKFTQ